MVYVTCSRGQPSLAAALILLNSPCFCVRYFLHHLKLNARQNINTGPGERHNLRSSGWRGLKGRGMWQLPFRECPLLSLFLRTGSKGSCWARWQSTCKLGLPEEIHIFPVVPKTEVSTGMHERGMKSLEAVRQGTKTPVLPMLRLLLRCQLHWAR